MNKMKNKTQMRVIATPPAHCGAVIPATRSNRKTSGDSNNDISPHRQQPHISIKRIRQVTLMWTPI